MYEEVWNQGNLNFIEKVFSPEFRDYPPKRFLELPVLGRESLYDAARSLRAAMPDFHDQMIQCVAEGNLVYYLGRITGMHTAPYLRLPPLGNRISLTSISGFHLENGMIVERWGIFDEMGMMQQMGIAPAGPGAH